MRGIFSTGVLDTFLQHDFSPYQQYFGVSAGATNLAAFLCGQYKRNYKVITDYSCRKEFISYPRFFRKGHLFDLDWLWHITIDELRLDLDAFDKRNDDFYIVSTAINSGQAHYLKATAASMEQQLKASCAIPIAYRDYPVIDGVAMTDGGMADSIPVQKAYEMGNRHITVILSQPLGYRKKPSRAKWLVNKLYAQHPALAEIALKRAHSYNASLDFIAQPPKDCHIEVIAPPSDFAVGRTTRAKHKLDAGYRMGVNAAQTFLQAN